MRRRSDSGPGTSVLLLVLRARLPGPRSRHHGRSFAPTSTSSSSMSSCVIAGVAVRRTVVLTAADFEVREDDKPQQVTSFDVEEVATHRSPPAPSPQLLTPAQDAGTVHHVGDCHASDFGRSWRGRRLMVLLFNLSSMQPEELERTTRAAADYVDHQMSDDAGYSWPSRRSTRRWRVVADSPAIASR